MSSTTAVTSQYPTMMPSFISYVPWILKILCYRHFDLKKTRVIECIKYCIFRTPDHGLASPKMLRVIHGPHRHLSYHEIKTHLGGDLYRWYLFVDVEKGNIREKKWYVDNHQTIRKSKYWKVPIVSESSMVCYHPDKFLEMVASMLHLFWANCVKILNHVIKGWHSPRRFSCNAICYIMSANWRQKEIVSSTVKYQFQSLYFVDCQELKQVSLYICVVSINVS